MLKLKKDVTLVKTDDDGTLVDADTGRYIALNWSATVMLTALMECETVSESVARVLNEVDADPETVERDLIQFQSQLEELCVVDSEQTADRPDAS